MESTEDYSDIIHLPYQGRKEGGLSMYQRAAQFAPFAALTGHGAAILETARLTDSKIELDDENAEKLNKRFAILREHLKELPEVTVTFFLPDKRKAGGSYATYSGNLRVIDEYEQLLIMKDGKKIPLPSILDIDSKIFDEHLPI
ncbi:MAG: hypothetical protein MJZ12_07755, partial [Prevotella sp.]|nr:hypothetical protein [Prevotella sp.]